MCQEVSLYRRRDISGPGVTKVRCCPQNGSSNGLLMIRVRRSCVIPATCLEVTHIPSDVQYTDYVRNPRKVQPYVNLLLLGSSRKEEYNMIQTRAW